MLTNLFIILLALIIAGAITTFLFFSILILYSWNVEKPQKFKEIKKIKKINL